MIVFAVFVKYLIEGHYQCEGFVKVYDSQAKAQAHIDAEIHQRKLDCKRRQLEYAFLDAWKAEHPSPYVYIRGTKPKFNQAMSDDREYQRLHEERVRVWRVEVERPYEDHMRAYEATMRAATTAYMATIDIEKQDLSDIDLAKYGEEDNLFIRELEVMEV